MMRAGWKIAGALSALAIATAPAYAEKPTTKPGNGYGKYCQNQSKKHVKGQKGTPFSQCVTAMAKLDKGTATTPKDACKGLSKKHVKGEKGTPYSRCVVAGAKLLKDKKDDETTTPTTPSS